MSSDHDWPVVSREDRLAMENAEKTYYETRARQSADHATSLQGTSQRAVTNVELTRDQVSWLQQMVERELAADYNAVFAGRQGSVTDEVMLRYRDSLSNIQDIVDRLHVALGDTHD